MTAPAFAITDDERGADIEAIFDRMQVASWFFNAVEARQHARSARLGRLPGWRLYHRSELKRAIRNWRRYAEAVRATQ